MLSTDRRRFRQGRPHPEWQRRQDPWLGQHEPPARRRHPQHPQLVGQDQPRRARPRRSPRAPRHR